MTIVRSQLPQLLAILVSLFISGCAHPPAPFSPGGFKLQPPGPVAECKSDKFCLQILIMYSPNICSHAALRLQAPDRPPLFWDPAGGYGREGSRTSARSNDILEIPPTLNQYLQFRTEIPTDTAEIFEWYISKKDMDGIYTILSTGTGPEHPQGDFSTQGTGFFCASHISDFLNRFGGDIIQVEQNFFPHNLARQLYEQDPGRVILATFRQGRVFFKLLDRRLSSP